MKQLESEQQFESLKQGATVFEFTAGWCPDCRVINQITGIRSEISYV